MTSAVTREHLEFGRSLAMEELMQDALSFLDEESAREQQQRRAQQASMWTSPSPPTPPPPRLNAADAVGLCCSTQPLSISSLISGPSDGASLLMPRKRATLDEASVVRIFLSKQYSKGPDLRRWLALQHGVTEKAVRDIWTGRTWRRVTAPYWNVVAQR